MTDSENSLFLFSLGIHVKALIEGGCLLRGWIVLGWMCEEVRVCVCVCDCVCVCVRGGLGSCTSHLSALKQQCLQPVTLQRPIPIIFSHQSSTPSQS